MSASIASHLSLLPIWDKQTYHLFLSIREKNEPDTGPILNLLRERGKTVIVSKTHFKERRMSHYILAEDTALRIGGAGIPEPIDARPISERLIEVVFVPALAFDRSGHRIGYGYGFYDRFLSSCPPHTLKVGISFTEPQSRIDGLLPTDVPMDFAATPQGGFTF